MGGHLVAELETGQVQRCFYEKEHISSGNVGNDVGIWVF